MNVTPLIMVLNPFLSIFRDAIVWCPFDTQESEFVKQIQDQNEVTYSHILQEEISLNMNP